MLVRHPGTAATRSAVLPGDEPALRPLPELAPLLGRGGRLLRSPARRCEVPDAQVDERLCPWDLGSWAGRPLAEVDLAAWRADPSYDAHGGESLLDLHRRVEALLEELADTEAPARTTVVAVTHAAVIKAAVVAALRAPVTASWDLDVHPASATELSTAGGGWRVVRVNAPL